MIRRLATEQLPNSPTAMIGAPAETARYQVRSAKEPAPGGTKRAKSAQNQNSASGVMNAAARNPRRP